MIKYVNFIQISSNDHKIDVEVTWSHNNKKAYIKITMA